MKVKRLYEEDQYACPPRILWMYLFYIINAFWISLKNRVQIIIAGTAFPDGLVACIVGKLLFKPVIIFCNGEDLAKFKLEKKKKPFIKYIYNISDKVIACSNFTKNMLLDEGVLKDKIKIMHPIVDIGYYEDRLGDINQQNILRKKLKIEDKTVLLTVGRLIDRKGFDIVINMLSMLKDEYPDLVYLIVGEGNEKKKLLELSKEKKVQDKIIFAGNVKEVDLPSYYAISDIFIMLNKKCVDFEGFGIVFLEAGLAKIPVIGGNYGGTSDSIIDGNTGFLVDPSDINQCLLVLKKLIIDGGLRKDIGNAGYEYVRNNFSLDAGVKEMDRLIGEII